MKFPLPKNFNGTQFAKEIGVGFYDVYVIENELFINADETRKDEITEKLKNHVPAKEVDHRQTALAKLIDLGLTEEEIAAL
jgi:hypothetical protein